MLSSPSWSSDLFISKISAVRDHNNVVHTMLPISCCHLLAYQLLPNILGRYLGQRLAREPRAQPIHGCTSFKPLPTQQRKSPKSPPGPTRFLQFYSRADSGPLASSQPMPCIRSYPLVSCIVAQLRWCPPAHTCSWLAAQQYRAPQQQPHPQARVLTSIRTRTPC